MPSDLYCALSILGAALTVCAILPTRYGCCRLPSIPIHGGLHTAATTMLTIAFFLGPTEPELRYLTLVLLVVQFTNAVMGLSASFIQNQTKASTSLSVNPLAVHKYIGFIGIALWVSQVVLIAVKSPVAVSFACLGILALAMVSVLISESIKYFESEKKRAPSTQSSKECLYEDPNNNIQDPEELIQTTSPKDKSSKVSNDSLPSPHSIPNPLSFTFPAAFGHDDSFVLQTDEDNKFPHPQKNTNGHTSISPSVSWSNMQGPISFNTTNVNCGPGNQVVLMFSPNVTLATSGNNPNTTINPTTTNNNPMSPQDVFTPDNSSARTVDTPNTLDVKRFDIDENPPCSPMVYGEVIGANLYPCVLDFTAGTDPIEYNRRKSVRFSGVDTFGEAASERPDQPRSVVRKKSLNKFPSKPILPQSSIPQHTMISQPILPSNDMCYDFMSSELGNAPPSTPSNCVAVVLDIEGW
eukprot:NODE_1502_length_1928_cov_24.013296_g1273_i0.p1 GENE.NODE_1502_length_1928_cov_24.013296_g1273_i0~~NODE_1502_length_1928_cov_24.013296_g1273_i0.p1  ORF type:complete len:467 (-),score=62.88 NODE_1502_length_1928_cov_24.013296_g1273_i0:442-1842(-)